MSVPHTRRSFLRRAAEVTVFAGLGPARSSDEAPRPPRKRALLVAVSEYQRKDDPRQRQTGAWWNLPTAHNVRLLEKALQKQGFLRENILTVVDRAARSGGQPHRNQYAATKVDILSAARDHLLNGIIPGDFWMLYLAGHGQQIEDGTRVRDEPDGMDESLVPVDWEHANARLAGTKNLRDDDLRHLINEFTRKRCEFNGQLGGVVILDTCCAGTLHLGAGLVRQGRAWDVQSDGPLPPDAVPPDADTMRPAGFRGVGKHCWPVLMATGEKGLAYAFSGGALPRALREENLEPGSLFTQGLCRQLEQQKNPGAPLTYQRLLDNAKGDMARWMTAFVGNGNVPEYAVQCPYGDGPLNTPIFCSPARPG